MNRREALLSVGGALSVAMAGCNDLTPGGDDDTTGNDDSATTDDGTTGNETETGGAERDIDYSSPEAVVAAHFAARSDGDLQGMLATIHSDSPVRPALESTNETALEDRASQLTITVDNTTVVEQNESEAIVEVTTTATSFGQESTETARVELRTENGDWKLWQAVQEESDVEPADVDVGDDPEAVYRRYFEAQSNGNLAVVLGVSHTEGPTYADFSQWTVSQYEEAASTQTFTVEETTVVEQTEDTAIVQGTVSWNAEFAEEPNTIEPQLELRTENGEWRVWDAPEEGS